MIPASHSADEFSMQLRFRPRPGRGDRMTGVPGFYLTASFTNEGTGAPALPGMSDYRDDVLLSQDDLVAILEAAGVEPRTISSLGVRVVQLQKAHVEALRARIKAGQEQVAAAEEALAGLGEAP